MKIVLMLLMFLFNFLLLTCNTTDPPVDKREIMLKPEDVSCTEAWIQLTSGNLQLPAEINITTTNAGNSKSHISILTTQDSLLYIDSLLPNQTYKLKATSSEDGVISNEINFTTMDTTSHNFNWETFTFGGEAGNSTFNDCAIISEDNIWCVGKVYLKDSIGNTDPNAYNAVHWNGNEWELKRINTNSCGGVEYPPIRTIFAFSPDDILFAHIDGSISHFNGIEFTNDCSLITQSNGSANKIWGISKNDFYVVNGNGFIAHYNGSQWTRIESGTDIFLSDIYSNGSNNIFISGADNLNFKGIVLKNDGVNNFGTLITSEIITESELHSKLYGSLSSVWVDEKNNLYTGGNILFHFRHHKWDYVRTMPENYIGGNPNVYYRGFIGAIRGNSSNDYWIVGDRNTVRHFNGYSWKQIGLPYNPMSYIIWRSLDVKNNLCVIVGDHLNKAMIMKIKK